MQLSASIIPGSHIDSNWRNLSKNAGVLCGVHFKLRFGQYIADQVPESALDALLNHHSVAVEFVTVLVGQVAAYEPNEPVDESNLSGQFEPKKPRGRPRKNI